MSSKIIHIGDVFEDREGMRLTVVEIDPETEQVTLEDDDGEEEVMDLDDLRDEIRSGELQRAE